MTICGNLLLANLSKYEQGTTCGGFWKRCSRGNKALLMFKECPVTNECPGLCLAIKGTSRTVCDDIFLFLKRVWRKKKLHPLSPAEQVTLCVISLPASEIHNAYQSMMRHEISGGRQMTCHFHRVPPSPEDPHRTNLILNRAPFMWATPSVCEEVPCCMWNLMRGNKGKGKKKESRAKYIFNGKEARGG